MDIKVTHRIDGNQLHWTVVESDSIFLLFVEPIGAGEVVLVFADHDDHTNTHREVKVSGPGLRITSVILERSRVEISCAQQPEVTVNEVTVTEAQAQALYREGRNREERR